MTDKFIRQLIHAANSVEQLQSTQRRHLLTRSIVIIHELIEKLDYLGPERINGAKAYTQQLAIAQIYALRSVEDVKRCLLDAANVIRDLKIIVERRPITSRKSDQQQSPNEEP